MEFERYARSRNIRSSFQTSSFRSTSLPDRPRTGFPPRARPLPTTASCADAVGKAKLEGHGECGETQAHRIGSSSEKHGNGSTCEEAEDEG